MAYIGNRPEQGNFRKCDAITTSATATYNLLVGGVAVNPNQNQCIVSLNGVIQSSGTSYTIASSQITFASALTSSDVIDFILILGDTLDVGVPSDDSIDASKITANVITGQSALGATPADTDELLISDAGTLKRVDYSYLKSTVVNRPNALPYIINGNFDVWQRGTSFTTSVYTADRWKQDLSGATATVTREAHTVGQTDVPDNPKYYLKQNVTTGNNNCGMLYRIEDVDTLTGAFTLSFYAKGVNPNSGNLDIIIQQNFGSGGSTTVSLTEQDLTLTASWQKFVFTGTLASLSGKTIGTSSYIQIIIKQPDDDANTAAWNLQISQVQLESGTYTSSTIPPFQHETYGDNLHRCQRYFQEVMSGESQNALCNLVSYTSGTLRGTYILPTQMRANPTQTDGAALADFLILGENTSFAPTALAAESLTKKSFVVTASSSSSTQGSVYWCRGDAEATYTLDAEL